LADTKKLSELLYGSNGLGGGYKSGKTAAADMHNPLRINACWNYSIKRIIGGEWQGYRR